MEIQSSGILLGIMILEIQSLFFELRIIAFASGQIVRIYLLFLSIN